MRQIGSLLILLGLLWPASAAFGQTGKITGQVIDAATGEELPSVNVVIAGTTQGATTDDEGFYTIINVRPGLYDVQASFIGFTPQTMTDVRVNIDLTSEVNFALREETVGLQEVTVMAERPIVQRDVSANVANFNAEEIENMPVAGVSEVIDLQAGIEPGMRIRGGTLDEVGFYIDGMATPIGRDQTPFTNVSFTSISEVQVQTGGFNAEYGDLRSGLVNVVTKDSPRSRYTADAMIRYSSPSRKFFGNPDDPMSYGNRQFLDMGDVTGDGVPDSVAFYGIRNVLDRWDWRNYDNTFEGYKAQIEKNLANDDPEDDHLTAEDLMAIYKYRTRRTAEVESPDYDVDLTFGGPIPGISRPLGDLRFLASYRQQQEAYALPAERDAFLARTGQFRLTSDIRRGMKITLMGMLAKDVGMNPSAEGNPIMLRGRNPVYPWQGDNWYFANHMNEGSYKAFGNLMMMDINRNMFGAELTHTINANTFYEVRLQRSYTDYLTGPGAVLDTGEIVAYVYEGEVYTEGDPGFEQARANGYGLDAGPLGFDPEHGINTPIGDRWRRGFNPGRDTSNTSVWTGSFDVTSQLNRFMQIKSGLSYTLSHYDVNHGLYDPYHPHHENPKFRWTRTPEKGAAYGQTKLEFRGMVANIGLRLDYFHAGGEWYNYSPYDLRLAGGGQEVLEEFETESTERLIAASPRLGVSFPITDNSKLFFNYGHMRQTLDPRWLYQVRVTDRGEIRELGNPNHPMPKTVAYELGYEQNLFDQFLLRVGGYYKDVSNEERYLEFTSADEQVRLGVRYPFNYEDVRGFEVTVSKNRGRFIRGFVNYTYLVRKEGDFGYPFRFENQVTQRISQEQHRNGQFRPVPEPFARFDIELLSPADFGPSVGGTRPLGDWRISLLGDWRSGYRFTWGGGQGATIEGIRDNMKWRNYYNLDLRLSKAFATTMGQAQFFIDVSNVLNIRRLNRWTAWGGDFNEDRYFRSLHLPQEFFHDRTGNLSPDAPTDILWGDDRPGDYRKDDVEFVPIIVGSLPETGEVRSGNRYGPLYAVRDANDNVSWYVWNSSAGDFEAADPGRVDQVLDDKAYIDMPAVQWRRFFNPRDVFFGIRLTF